MGPTTLDLTFIWVGLLMASTGCALYFMLEIWKNLRDSYLMLPATPPVFISFGLASATNGLVLGYGMKMSTMAVIILTVISIAAIVWCIFAIHKLIKLTSA